jgi:hypothetical protein
MWKDQITAQLVGRPGELHVLTAYILCAFGFAVLTGLLPAGRWRHPARLYRC